MLFTFVHGTLTMPWGHVINMSWEPIDMRWDPVTMSYSRSHLAFALDDSEFGVLLISCLSDTLLLCYIVNILLASNCLEIVCLAMVCFTLRSCVHDQDMCSCCNTLGSN
jgi:hypothetical protein